MSKRDDFTEYAKRRLALRADHHCSFRGCPQPTSGPSEEAPDAVNMVGEAAHIHGAASGWVGKADAEATLMHAHQVARQHG